MTTSTLVECEAYESDQYMRHERMRRKTNSPMPVHRSLSTFRGMRRSTESRSAGRRSLGKHGGIHKRRRRKQTWMPTLVPSYQSRGAT